MVRLTCSFEHRWFNFMRADDENSFHKQSCTKLLCTFEYMHYITPTLHRALRPLVRKYTPHSRMKVYGSPLSRRQHYWLTANKVRFYSFGSIPIFLLSCRASFAILLSIFSTRTIACASARIVSPKPHRHGRRHARGAGQRPGRYASS